MHKRIITIAVDVELTSDNPITDDQISKLVSYMEANLSSKKPSEVEISRACVIDNWNDLEDD